MKRPILLKLFVSYLLLILVLSGIILAFVFNAFSTHAVDTAADHLERLGLALEYTSKPLLEQKNTAGLNSFIRKVGADTRVRITVIGGGGGSSSPIPSTPRHPWKTTGAGRKSLRP